LSAGLQPCTRADTTHILHQAAHPYFLTLSLLKLKTYLHARTRKHVHTHTYTHTNMRQPTAHHLFQLGFLCPICQEDVNKALALGVQQHDQVLCQAHVCAGLQVAQPRCLRTPRSTVPHLSCYLCAFVSARDSLARSEWHMRVLELERVMQWECVGNTAHSGCVTHACMQMHRATHTCMLVDEC